MEQQPQGSLCAAQRARKGPVARQTTAGVDGSVDGPRDSVDGPRASTRSGVWHGDQAGDEDQVGVKKIVTPETDLYIGSRENAMG